MRLIKVVAAFSFAALLGAAPAFIPPKVDFETLRGPNALKSVEALGPTDVVRLGNTALPAFVLKKLLLNGYQRRTGPKTTTSLHNLAQNVIVPSATPAPKGTKALAPVSVGSLSAAITALFNQMVEIPPQQTGSTNVPASLGIPVTGPCAVTLCAAFGDGHDAAVVVTAADYTTGLNGVIVGGQGQLDQNPDGSYVKAPDGNCILTWFATSAAYPNGVQTETVCPGTTVQVQTPYCEKLCVPQHATLTISDTFFFDHYVAQCDKGFNIDVETGTDDGVSHTLNIDITYPSPELAHTAPTELFCNVDVFIRGPNGSDWN
jgi:hypothetical protein